MQSLKQTNMLIVSEEKYDYCLLYPAKLKAFTLFSWRRDLNQNVTIKILKLSFNILKFMIMINH